MTMEELLDDIYWEIRYQFPVERDLTCPQCGAKMRLRKTDRFKYHNERKRWFYACERYPLCKATHNCHYDGTPLGVPGDKLTRKKRCEFHIELAKSFDGYNSLYLWLSENSEVTHVGEMTISQIKRLELKLKQKNEQNFRRF